jgi:tRNA-dihydrouridine synthase C
MGTDIGLLCRAAGRLRDLGVAGVDLNCGCPSKSVIRSGAGGDCLRRTDWLRAACVALRQACPDCGFSVKLRAGFASADELPAIAAAVQAGRPDFVILHFRTVLEEYQPVPDGVARLAFARELMPDTVLIGSGDLYTMSDAAAMAVGAGVDGVAPARGLLRNPRLLRDLEDLSAGRAVRPFGEHDQVEFLLDLALAARDQGFRYTGFLAEIAKHMSGVDSRLFAELGRRSGDLNASIAMLRERCTASTARTPRVQ